MAKILLQKLTELIKGLKDCIFNMKHI